MNLQANYSSIEILLSVSVVKFTMIELNFIAIFFIGIYSKAKALNEL